MSALILFATKSGAAEACAGLLAGKLRDSTVCSLSRAVPDLSRFDTVIVGSGVRMGKFYRPARRFIRANMDLLLTKRTAFYLCNADPETFWKAVEKNIPEKLVRHAACIQSFGGRPPFVKTQSMDWLNEGNLEAFADAVTG